MSPSKRSSSPTSASSSSRAGACGGPLGRSNFVVDWGGGASAVAQAFAEVVFPPFMLEGRTGTAAATPRTTSSDAAAAEGHLLLRRGATGALDLYDWWDRARRGQAPRRRVVTVRLLGADGKGVVMTWRFRNARPVSLSYSPLLAMEAGVLMETIAIAFDSVEME